VDSIKRQTGAACGCVAVKLQARVCVPIGCTVYARFVCDAKRRCSCSALYQRYLLPFGVSEFVLR